MPELSHQAVLKEKFAIGLGTVPLGPGKGRYKESVQDVK